MKKYLFISMWLLLCTATSFAEGKLQIGETFPDRVLQRPAEQGLADYLGIASGNNDFSVKDIRAELVLVEFFSMYCPHCQHEAPLVNNLYAMIQDNKLNQKIKMVGIGIGNSAYEVGIFQEKFTIPFPLFADENFIWHKQVGEVGTPYFVLVRNDTGTSTVVLTHLGRIESAASFFKKIKEHL
ncbi:MAG: TlpA disulfide reductase family protein [Desulfoplanes sp.]